MKFRVVVCRIIVLIASIGFAIGIVVLAPSMVPVRRGTPHEFWNIATGVALSPNADFGWGGNAYIVDETWAAYDVFHMHGSHLYCVPLRDVAADLDAIIAKLEEAAQSGKSGRSVKGFLAWRNDQKQHRGVRGLVESVARERLRHLAERDVTGVVNAGADEQLFWRRWRQADWYWADFAFEWIFLSSLTLFALWPGLRSDTAWGWGMHVALLPILFLMPAYLGYATLSLTSAGPTGGILYPFLLMCCRGGSCSAIDEMLLKYTPQILEPLSAPIGSPIALTGFGLPGPSTALICGLLYGGSIIVLNLAYKWWVNRPSANTSSNQPG